MSNRLLFVFGTRPEAIKMATVVKAFQEDGHFDTRVCVTGQHREMLDQVLDFFEITPDYDLNVMRKDQDLYSLTSLLLNELKKVFQGYDPNYIFVHGDTTTSTAAALAGFYHGAKVCHVEAGLRTYNKRSPFPEEMNRQLTGRLTDYHFAPTERAKQNLLGEGVDSEKICVTGNTVIDALQFTVNKVKNITPDWVKGKIDFDKKLILVTGHRRENFGAGMRQICKGLVALAKAKSDIQIIYPVHLNPNVQGVVHELLTGQENILLIEPLSYPAFVWLMDKSHIIITDSGGVQEEAPGLGKPVLVTRDTTERPEAVHAGTVKLVGTDSDELVQQTLNLLDNTEAYRMMSESHNPYGDGEASRRILNYLKQL